MYWNYVVFSSYCLPLQLNSNIRCIEIIPCKWGKDKGSSWIVTLDVLKWATVKDNVFSYPCWIVTLDVLK